MYGDFPVGHPQDFADFHISLASPGFLRRWVRPQVNFYFDGVPSFKPLPLGQAYPMMEWGLNWCIASQCHQYLIIHAAAIERNGRAAILPAPPGSGKSTLCAGLVARGWRLLSDELTLLDVERGTVQALSRPINLKNESIGVVRRFQPDAVMTPPVSDTVKGTVALMRPPRDSVRRVCEPARPAWIIFPRFRRAAPATFSRYSKGRTCLTFAEQSFNYDIYGVRRFEAVAREIESCDCFEFTYGDLEEAARAFAKLVPSS